MGDRELLTNSPSAQSEPRNDSTIEAQIAPEYPAKTKQPYEATLLELSGDPLSSH